MATETDSAATLLTVNVRMASGKSFSVNAEPSKTVPELQAMFVEPSGIPADLQRVIYGGRILKEADSLASIGFKSGNTLHLVKSAPSATSAPSSAARAQAPATPATPAPASTTPASAPAPASSASQPAAAAMPPLFGDGGNPFGGLGGLGMGMGMDMGMGMGMGMPDMAQQLRANPEMMRQMLSNPMMQQLLDNPEIMRNMMESNPALQEVMRRNPQMREVLRDPEIMRQSLAAMRNPALFQEMMRQQDRALSNLEAHPGGMNILTQLYNDVQQPLMEAMQAPLAPAPAADNPFAALLTNPPQSAPNTDPIQDPWAPPRPASSSTPAGARVGGGSGAGAGAGAGVGTGTGAAFGASRSAMFGGLGGMDNPASMAAAMGISEAQMMEMTQQMMQQPGYMQMMREMASNPAVMRQIMMSNPMVRGNPAMQQQVEQMLQNPALIAQLADPANIQAMLQLRRSGLFGAAGAPDGGFGGLFPPGGSAFGGSFPPAPAPTPAATSASSAAAPSGESFSGSFPPAYGPAASRAATTTTTTTTSSSSAPAPASSAPAPAPGSGSLPGAAPAAGPAMGANPFEAMMRMFGGMSGAAPGAPVLPPRERFASQLRQLQDMGFADEELNIQILEQTNGNVDAALNFYFS